MAFQGKSDPILEMIYEASLDQSCWNEVFLSIANTIGADTILSSIQNHKSNNVDVISNNISEYFISEYAKHWWKEDVWMKGAIRLLGKPVITRDVDPSEEMLKRPIYHDFAKPIADLRYVAGAVIPIDGAYAVMGVHRTGRSRDFDDQDRHYLGLLLPHIQRSMSMMQRFEANEQRARLADTMFDQFPYAILAVDAEARPLSMNARARDMLRNRVGLLKGSANVPLTAEKPSDTRQLHQAVVQAATLQLSDLSRGVLLQRSSGRTSFLAIVTPLTGPYRSVFGIYAPAAMVIIQDPDELPVPPQNLLQNIYGLTPAEAALAVQLGEGLRLEEVSERSPVKISTLRTQLRSILQKTNTDRQATLVRLITSLGHARPRER